MLPQNTKKIKVVLRSFNDAPVYVDIVGRRGGCVLVEGVRGEAVGVMASDVYVNDAEGVQNVLAAISNGRGVEAAWRRMKNASVDEIG